MIDYTVWFFPLTGILGGIILLSNMHSWVVYYGIKNPLESKGIFDPIQKIKLAIVCLFADFSWKINVSYWALSWEEEDLLEYDFIATFYGFAFNIVIIFVLCKYLLPEIKIRQIRKTSNSTNYSRWGFILSTIFFLDALLSFCLQIETCWYVDEKENLVFTILCLGIGFLISMGPYNILKRYDRIKGEAERTISSLVTNRAPIIFLRSFEIDKFLIKGYSFDEYICRSFSMTSQPILSLSDPNDFLPTGGSIKIQSFDEKWKDAIIALFKNCRAVVIFEGKSEGLQWEIENLKKYVSYDKLFIATPPKNYRISAWCTVGLGKERKYALGFIWKNFSKHLNKEGFYLPSTDPGSDTIFSFNNNWEAVNSGDIYKGMKLFDYIMEKTVKYENANCNYKRLADTLSAYELSLSMSLYDKKRINKALVLITGIIVCITICITIFL